MVKYPNKNNIDFPGDSESTPRLYYSHLWGSFYRKKLDILFDLAPDGKFENGLEVGFGGGISLVEMAQRFDNLVALDLHAYFKNVEQMLKKENVSNCTLLNHDIFKKPLPHTNHFDYAISSSVFEHIPKENLGKGIKAVADSLKPNGLFLIGFPLKNIIMNSIFEIFSFTYLAFKPDIYKFSQKHDHPSGYEEIAPAIEKYFEIEEKKYFFGRFLKLYTVLKCKKK